MADTGDFTTPTWEELSDEQHQGYEVLGRKFQGILSFGIVYISPRGDVLKPHAI